MGRNKDKEISVLNDQVIPYCLLLQQLSVASTRVKRKDMQTSYHEKKMAEKDETLSEIRFGLHKANVDLVSEW